jgi:hypothetical protein
MDNWLEQLPTTLRIGGIIAVIFIALLIVQQCVQRQDRPDIYEPHFQALGAALDGAGLLPWPRNPEALMAHFSTLTLNKQLISGPGMGGNEPLLGQVITGKTAQNEVAELVLTPAAWAQLNDADLSAVLKMLHAHRRRLADEISRPGTPASITFTVRNNDFYLIPEVDKNELKAVRVK